MKYRREIFIVCLFIALAASVAYDAQFLIERPEIRRLAGAAVVACLAAALALVRYPLHAIQPALLAAWPLHLFTISFGIVSYCFHGSAQLGSFIAYTVVAYLTYLVVPLILLLDRHLLDLFVKMVAVGSALLAIPSFIGAMGMDSVAGIPLRNKPAYSQFSGLIASGGIFEHAEGHALQMAVGLFCCVYALRKTRSVFYLICLGMVLAGLVISQGRAAIFGVVIAGAISLLPELFRRSRPVLIVSLILCWVIPFVIWTMLAEIPGISNYLRLQRGLSGRDVAWEYALSLVDEKPWTGHGFGTSSELSEAGRAQLRKSGYSGAGTTFHNTFITKAVELGIIATSIYALLYFVPLIRVSGPVRDREVQNLARSVVILAITACLFRDYNIGGIRSTTILLSVFLGIGNLWLVFASAEATPQTAADQKSSQDRLIPSADEAVY